MADAIWYYAKNDQQQGPVTAAQLKSLAASGELLPTDLVWKEGMENWSPASGVSGLFPTLGKSAAEPAPTAPSTSAGEKESPAAMATAPATAAPPGSRWANAPPSASPSGSTVSAPEPPPAPGRTSVTPTSQRSRTAPRTEPTQSASKAFSLPAWLGPSVLIGGLVLVLMIRGCDSLGERNAARLQAKATVTKDRFEDAWQTKRLELEAEQARIQAIPENGLRKTADLEAVQERLQALATDKQKEKSQLERQRWRDLEIAARDAKADNAMWAYWRQLCFLPATLLLVAGLLMVAITHEGPQRWICLIVLAIIAYSLFVGGAAWQ